MGYDDWIKHIKDGENQPRKKPTAKEHALQVACVRWFALRYPKCHEQGSLIAVPNGGRRDRRTGAILKAEGVVAGASDLILFKPTARSHALLIEMKYGKEGRQSESQRTWQQGVTADGYRYEVVRCLEQFISLVEGYMEEYETYKLTEL